ncbi:hypothetical protein SPFM7_00195 [Salmonella phage SPFM7]|nr:hypothetical protein SPFM7_00195 [Salmonella phage SPFM7]
MLLKPSLSLAEARYLLSGRYLEHLAKTPAQFHRSTILPKWLQISWVRPTIDWQEMSVNDHGYKLSIIMPRGKRDVSLGLADALGPEVPWEPGHPPRQFTAQRGRIFATVRNVLIKEGFALSAAITKRKLNAMAHVKEIYVVPFRSCLNAPYVEGQFVSAAEKEALLLAAVEEVLWEALLLPFSAILGSFTKMLSVDFMCKHGPKRNIKMQLQFRQRSVSSPPGEEASYFFLLRLRKLLQAE